MTNQLFLTQRFQGTQNEEFLAVESTGQSSGRTTESIDVKGGMNALSVFLTEPSESGFKKASDVSIVLVSADGTTYGTGTPERVDVVGTKSSVINTTMDIGHIIYIEKPTEGEWELQIESSDNAIFSCEVRVLPDLELEKDIADITNDDLEANTGIRSLLNFAGSLPKTMISEQIEEALKAENPSDESMETPCLTCQRVAIVALAVFGIAALVAAALLVAIIGTAALGPVGASIVAALATIGIVVIIALVIDVIAKFVPRLQRGDIDPIIFSYIGKAICIAVRVC